MYFAHTLLPHLSCTFPLRLRCPTHLSFLRFLIQFSCSWGVGPAPEGGAPLKKTDSLPQQLPNTNISSACQLVAGSPPPPPSPNAGIYPEWSSCGSCVCWSQSLWVLCESVLLYFPETDQHHFCLPPLPHTCGSCGEGCGVDMRLWSSTPKFLILCILPSWRSSCWFPSTARSSISDEGWERLWSGPDSNKPLL